MRDVRIGTSGWAYRDWAGPFYPDEVKAAGRLEYISRRFRTLEINASFYRMPTDAAVAGVRRRPTISSSPGRPPASSPTTRS